MMRWILDNRDYGRSTLQDMILRVKAGEEVAIEAGCEERTSMIVTPNQMQPATLQPQGSATPAHGGQLGRTLSSKSPARSPHPKGSRSLRVPLDMLEELLGAIERVSRQHAAPVGATGHTGQETAAATGQGATSAGSVPTATKHQVRDAEEALLPKEAFILHLVLSCCGTAAQPKDEKVVVFTEVGCVGLTGLG